ncbi:hypothetical protein HMPREF0731_1371, partial [Pseudoroseomonas cervicalis ATCC 49957]
QRAARGTTHRRPGGAAGQAEAVDGQRAELSIPGVVDHVGQLRAQREVAQALGHRRAMQRAVQHRGGAVQVRGDVAGRARVAFPMRRSVPGGAAHPVCSMAVSRHARRPVAAERWQVETRIRYRRLTIPRASHSQSQHPAPNFRDFQKS